MLTTARYGTLRKIVSDGCLPAHEDEASFSAYKKDMADTLGKQVYTWVKRYTMRGDELVYMDKPSVVVSHRGRAFDDLRELHEESAWSRARCTHPSAHALLTVNPSARTQS